MSSSHTNIVLLLTLFSSLQLISHVISFEYQVGDNKGWIVPPPNDTKTYNDWASEKRFKVGDTVRFKYKKDSVMEVSEKDYKNCNATHPVYFSNTGNTLYNLDHPGYFYFISGAAGHCGKGQRIIIKVMSLQDNDAPPSGGVGGRGGTSGGGSAALGCKNVAVLFVCGVFNLVIIFVQSSIYPTSYLF